ncbi:MAG: PAS-domain containing protein [Azospirillaceae bacterium]|nr:PAS-domain containing protein [Azospirillaceae bacterium]
MKSTIGKAAPLLVASGLAAVALPVLVFVLLGQMSGTAPLWRWLISIAVPGTAAVAILFWRQFRHCGRLRATLANQNAEIARLEAFLSAAPDPYFGWSGSGAQAIAPALAALLGIERCTRHDDIETALEPGDAAALHGASQHLRQTGSGFRLVVHSAIGRRSLEVTGHRGTASSGAESFDVLWFRDFSAVADQLQQQADATSAAKAAQAELRTALDALPVLVWLRRRDLSMIWCNKAYAAAVELSPTAVITTQQELSSGLGRSLADRARRHGIAQSEKVHMVIAGARRFLDIVEAPLPAQLDAPELIVGYALDITDREDLETELNRHIVAHAQVLEQLGTAIAIYGADTRLKFFNQTYVTLWELDESWLRSEPLYSEVLEDLRTRRRLPEYADFVRFKREQLAEFTSLLEPSEDLLHLPDGTTLRKLTVPHPFGGLMYVMEDVTNALALETSYNTLMAVQQETLDNLAEGIAVFGGDGRLKLANPAFARIWHLQRADLQLEPHASTILDKTRHLYFHGDDWAEFREEMIANTLDRAMRTGRLVRTDGSVVEFANVPLPDGAVLTSYVDITDSVRVEKALRERTAALDTADRLKAEFVDGIAAQLRMALVAINSGSEILAEACYRSLTPRQHQGVRSVADCGGNLTRLIEDLLDLATADAGSMVLKRGPTAVPALLAEVAALTNLWARHRGVTLTVDCPPDFDSVELDARRVRQALFNLVANALCRTDSGGTVRLSAHRTSDRLILSVEDHDAPVPAVAAWVGVDGTRPADGAGAPITPAVLATAELALVRRFIELHGATVDATPTEGGRMRVQCEIPIATDDGPPHDPA